MNENDMTSLAFMTLNGTSNLGSVSGAIIVGVGVELRRIALALAAKADCISSQLVIYPVAVTRGNLRHSCPLKFRSLCNVCIMTTVKMRRLLYIKLLLENAPNKQCPPNPGNSIKDDIGGYSVKSTYD